MGFFDEILADVKVFTDEIQGIKDEFVSAVIDPTGDLRDTVNDIAGQLTGSAPSDDSAYSDDTTTQPTE